MSETGYSYWAVVEKKTGSLVGVCGLIAEQAEGELCGYRLYLQQRALGRGYAAESAAGCMDYAFRVLQLERSDCADQTGQQIFEEGGGEVGYDSTEAFFGKLPRKRRAPSSLLPKEENGFCAGKIQRKGRVER